MNILVVEDDYLQGEWLCEELRRVFSRRPFWINSESEFRARLDEIERDTPDVAVIDVMLRWTHPSPEMAARPADARDIFGAGLRCQRLLASRPQTSSIPVILYTVLERVDLGEARLLPNVTHLRKESDLDALLQLIRQVVRKK
jgi:CheY-like chemotaxis protein